MTETAARWIRRAGLLPALIALSLSAPACDWLGGTERDPEAGDLAARAGTPTLDRLGLPPTLSRVEQADYVLGKWLEVAGLTSEVPIASRRQVGMLQYEGNTQPVEILTVQKWPDKVYRKLTFSGGSTIEEAADGDQGWRKEHGRKPVTLTPVELRRVQAGTLKAERSFTERYPNRKLISRGDFGGREVFRVELDDGIRERLVLYIDARSWHLAQARSVYREGDLEVKFVTSFDVYKKVDGILLPHYSVVEAGDGGRWEIRIQQVEQGVAVPDKLFKRPRR